MKWAIIGTSFISDVMAEAIKGDKQSELYAVSGRSEIRLKKFAEKYNIPKTYTDYQAMIEDSEVDIVYIALPNHLHHEYIQKAAKAGKAILCEKSLSVDMEKTYQALSSVKEKNVFFAEGLMYMCHPLIKKALEVLKNGEIGEIKSIQASYIAAISEFVNPNSKGALYNLGCYPMSLAYLILSQILPEQLVMDLQISGFGRKGRDGNICEATATLRFADKINLQIHTAEDYGLKHGFTVLGSKGSLTFNSNPWLPTEKNLLEVEIYETEKKVIEVNADGDAFFYQVRAIREAVQQGAKELEYPKATHKASKDIMQLLTSWEEASIIG
ncbi:Gfo/Idh/MocA family oxidoreductase [Vibrio sp. EA2]|uniref:Gfo/Idh/MocA family protein n=1 Tax=Vibrio sp. EA2 TaxID=3079860 RepID=UPI002949B7B2|nr:Gfo/Idh/MocA family oxidoreductase [Vibrio sp. EA2]MDV6253554.1 Gfo/Idh/MocA family oxidoreductase [Vibrio sp. EA2]